MDVKGICEAFAKATDCVPIVIGSRAHKNFTHSRSDLNLAVLVSSTHEVAVTKAAIQHKLSSVDDKDRRGLRWWLNANMCVTIAVRTTVEHQRVERYRNERMSTLDDDAKRTTYLRKMETDDETKRAEQRASLFTSKFTATTPRPDDGTVWHLLQASLVQSHGVSFRCAETTDDKSVELQCEYENGNAAQLVVEALRSLYADVGRLSAAYASSIRQSPTSKSSNNCSISSSMPLATGGPEATLAAAAAPGFVSGLKRSS